MTHNLVLIRPWKQPTNQIMWWGNVVLFLTHLPRSRQTFSNPKMTNTWNEVDENSSLPPRKGHDWASWKDMDSHGALNPYHHAGVLGEAWSVKKVTLRKSKGIWLVTWKMPLCKQLFMIFLVGVSVWPSFWTLLQLSENSSLLCYYWSRAISHRVWFVECALLSCLTEVE